MSLKHCLLPTQYPKANSPRQSEKRFENSFNNHQFASKCWFSCRITQINYTGPATSVSFFVIPMYHRKFIYHSYLILPSPTNFRNCSFTISAPPCMRFSQCESFLDQSCMFVQCGCRQSHYAQTHRKKLLLKMQNSVIPLHQAAKLKRYMEHHKGRI